MQIILNRWYIILKNKANIEDFISETVEQKSSDPNLTSDQIHSKTLKLLNENPDNKSLQRNAEISAFLFEKGNEQKPGKFNFDK